MLPQFPLRMGEGHVESVMNSPHYRTQTVYVTTAPCSKKTSFLWGSFVERQRPRRCTSSLSSDSSSERREKWERSYMSYLKRVYEKGGGAALFARAQPPHVAIKLLAGSRVATQNEEENKRSTVNRHATRHVYQNVPKSVATICYGRTSHVAVAT